MSQVIHISQREKFDAPGPSTPPIFRQFDELKAVIRESIKETKLNISKRVNHPYTSRSTYSTYQFYIGRGVTRITFYECSIGMFYLIKVKHRMTALYPQFRFYIHGGNFSIYLRGERK